MKKIFPSDCARLSKEGLGLGDVITMAYINQASAPINIPISNVIDPNDLMGLPSFEDEQEEKDNHFLDAMRYSLGVRLYRSKDDDFFEIPCGPILHEEPHFSGYASDMPKPKELGVYLPHGLIKITTPISDEFLKNLRESWDKQTAQSTGCWNVPIIGDVSPGIEPHFSNTYQRKSDPVYNNTLHEFLEQQSKMIKDIINGDERKQCDCGAQKTYGKDCKASFHSSWCSIK